MRDRLKNYESPSLAAEFSNFLLNQQVMLYQNQEDLRALALDFIKFKVEKAKREGATEAVKKISVEIIKQMQSYANLITKIVDFVYKVSKDEFKDKEFKIIEGRTNFCFETRRINILFVIDANFENELFFSNMLNDISKMVLEEDNFIAELFYINKKNTDLDVSLINNEYPFVRKIGY